MGAGGFKCHTLILQRLEEFNLWQVSILPENFRQSKVPDEVFLLENVRQVLIGIDTEYQATQQKNRGLNTFKKIFSKESNEVSQI